MLLTVFFGSAAIADDLKVPDAEQIIGRPDGSPLSGPQLDLRAVEVSAKLRCPVCQGMSIGDSPSVMAGNMKQQVRELLVRGYTEPQILDYFERSYGQFVLLEPKVGGVNWIVWLAPAIALLVGAGVVALAAHRLRGQHSARAEAFVKANALAAETGGGEVDPYLARARELVYRAPEDESKR